MLSYITIGVVIVLAILLLNVINVLRDRAATRSKVKTMLILNSLTFPVLILVAVLVFSIPGQGLVFSAMTGSGFIDLIFGIMVLWLIFTVAFLIMEILLILKLRRTS